VKPNPNQISIYKLYEESVQCPDWHVKHFPRFHEWLTGNKPYRLREDFCGTATISCEWVKKSPKHLAVGLDLDAQCLSYAKSENISKLTLAQQKQISLVKKNVLQPTREKYDMVAACNFSFFTFHDRKTLLHYAKAVRKSLKPKGTFFMEMAGGEGMLEEIEEPKSFSIKGYGRYKYVWEQYQYDPITGISDYAIHYRLPNGRWIKNAFDYHWRLWGIREVREILIEAGFKKTQVFWEACDRDGQGTGEFVPMQHGDHAHAWIAYVVGVN
jgi:hypothetical protein